MRTFAKINKCVGNLILTLELPSLRTGELLQHQRGSKAARPNWSNLPEVGCGVEAKKPEITSHSIETGNLGVRLQKLENSGMVKRYILERKTE